MSPSRSSRVALLSIALAIAAVGCGDDGETSSAGGGGGGGGTTDATTTATGTGGEGGAGQGGATTSSSGGAGGGACDAPLDQETLDALELTGNGVGKMLATATAHPGETVDFDLGVFECCYEMIVVDACASFTIEPAEGATIDAETGVVTVDPSTPHGTTFTITADVEDGRRELSAELFVWTEAGNPIAGLYTEESQLACEGGEREPEQVMGEVAFFPDQRFGVTWTPFEVYVDYWGTYVIDAEAGTLELTVEGGNFVPDDVDPVGTFRFDGDRLFLEDMFLGTPSGGVAAPACGHVLR